MPEKTIRKRGWYSGRVRDEDCNPLVLSDINFMKKKINKKNHDLNYSKYSENLRGSINSVVCCT